MLRNAMVSDMPDGRSVQPPPPPGKLAAQLKLPFGDSCWKIDKFKLNLEDDCYKYKSNVFSQIK